MDDGWRGPPILEDELIMAIFNLRDGKAVEWDEIPVEVLKDGGGAGTIKLPH